MNTAVKDKNKKYYAMLIASGFFLYLMSICIKMVYSAELVTIIPYFNTTKSDAALGLTFYYVAYSATQLLIATKIKIKNFKRFLCVTTLLSSLSFGMIIISNSMWQIWIILGLNGIFQSSVWGGIMHYFGKYLPDSYSNAVSLIMSLAFALGTAVAYGASSAFVAVLNWKYTFVFFAALMLISLILFAVSEKIVKARVCKTEVKESGEEKLYIRDDSIINTISKKNLYKLVFYLCGMTFLVCCIYYGLTNWVPSLLKEVHGVGDSYSMLITILIPVGTMFGPVVANYACEKNGMVFRALTLLSLIVSVFPLILIFAYDFNIVFFIIASVILLFFNRGMMNLICGYLPLKLRHVLNSGSGAMLFNAASCMGAAIVPTATGYLMDVSGENSWRNLYIMISVCAILLLLLSLNGAIKQKNKRLF